MSSSGMDGKLPITRHFFKVMILGFRTKLHHSLNLGDFAVFEHKGKMHFDVYVFDNSACEKEFVPVAGKKKKEVPVKLARGTIKREPVALTKEFPLKLAHGIKRESNGVSIPLHAKRVKSERPLEEAASNSPRISHFKSTIKPSNGIHHRAYMNVPLEFIKSNNLSQICSVTLRDPSGKLWLVEVRSRNSSLRTYWYLANGWHEFFVSHKLKEGDVCAFELNHTTTRAKNVFLDVQIFRAPI
ncbi:B3 domain-containing protein REM9-like isoform X2 [Cornus florida]|uniref:B3 domain-containing protein REM9-like isoform X2 n=1 Tax=Cornus florida TaxID=4283 RepID=UPI00289DE2C4|nr:B3 domain-containing protein REM9-like isoform X2 [Cornus florida]